MRLWVGRILMKVGAGLLGASGDDERRSIPPPPAIPGGKIVEFSQEAERMLADIHLPKKQREPEPPMEGSVMERLVQARAKREMGA